jgi:site-specific DNA-methyltransferase (adenine-specific)
MHHLAGDRQMTDVWLMPAIASWEKTCGKHPTQKPLALVVRTILASTKRGARILDPFAGSSTTGIAANILGRSFVGIEKEQVFFDMSVARRMQLPAMKRIWRQKIPDIAFLMNEFQLRVPERGKRAEVFLPGLFPIHPAMVETAK